MSAPRRTLQALARAWEQRPAQIASLVGIVLALAVVPLLPYGRKFHPSTSAKPHAAQAIPARRLVGPKTLPAPTAADKETQAVLTVGRSIGPIRHGGATRPLVALTFDDGPSPYTGRILAILRRTKTPATFFQVGKNLDENPDPGKATTLLEDVEIADHTYTHHSLATMTFREQQDEIISSAATMEAHGEPVPRLFRPPYGAYNQDTERLVQERGMAIILWSVDSEDYVRPGVDQIVHNVMSAVAPGAIVLLHDGGGDRAQTAAALPTIIKRLRARGYGLVTVPELLLKDPPRKDDQEVGAVPPGAGHGAG